MFLCLWVCVVRQTLAHRLARPVKEEILQRFASVRCVTHAVGFAYGRTPAPPSSTLAWRVVTHALSDARARAPPARTEESIATLVQAQLLH